MSATPRPQITSAPPVLHFGEAFDITVDRDDILDAIVLTRQGARTHSLDTDQRLLILAAMRKVRGHGSITLSAHMPVNSTFTPPGPYMIWALRKCASGGSIPSVARLVSVRAPEVADVMLRHLRLTFVTGDDNLDGGDNNATGYFVVDGNPLPDFPLNNGATWDDHSTHVVETDLPTPVSLRHLDHFGIHTTFSGGLFGKNWKLVGIRIEYRKPDGSYEQIINRSASPYLVYLKGGGGPDSQWLLSLF